VKKARVVLLFVLLALMATSLFAQAPTEEPAAAGRGGVKWGAVSAAFVLGIAAAAGAIGQSRAISSACEGIARNPSAAPAIRLSMIIGLALIESLVIYALLIALMVQGK